MYVDHILSVHQLFMAYKLAFSPLVYSNYYLTFSVKAVCNSK